MLAPEPDLAHRVRWHQRLENWALWKVGGSGAGTTSDAYETGRNWEWWRHPPLNPTPLVGEAIDTDKLVRQLDSEQFEAVEVVFLWTYPYTLEERCADMRKPIHRNTLTNRLNAAKDRLEELDQAQRRAQRARLRMITQSA